MLYYVINGLIGAAVAIFISYVGRTNLYVLAGLIPLFPTFTLFAQINAYQLGGEKQLKEVVIFGIISVIPYLIYLGSLQFSLMNNLKFSQAGFLSIFIWCVSAFFVFYLARKYVS